MKKKLLSILLSLTLVISAFSIPVSAEEYADPDLTQYDESEGENDESFDEDEDFVEEVEADEFDDSEESDITVDETPTDHDASEFVDFEKEEAVEEISEENLSDELLTDDTFFYGQAETLGAGGYPESAHPYGNNTDETQSYTEEDAISLSVTFSSDTKVEEDYDFIYLYQGVDTSGELIGKYTGSELSGKTIEIPGSSFCIRLVSDDNKTAYGYRIKSIIPTKDLTGKCGDNLNWEIDASGTLYITGTGEMFDYSWDYGRYDDDYYGYYSTAPWFKDRNLIKKCVISEGVTKIGAAAFYRLDNMTEAAIPNTVKKIGSRAFCHCTGLSNVTIPQSVISIGYYAFCYDDGDYDDDYYSGGAYRCMPLKGYANSSAEKYAYDYNGSFTVINKLSTPVIKSVAATTTGAKVTWNAVSGATLYRLYRMNSKGEWKKVADTSAVSYVDKTAVSGQNNVYTVRCISQYCKKAISDYNKTGKTLYYLSNTAISSLANTASGVKITWKKVTGAKGYYVYRKTGSGSYSRIKTITSGATVSFEDKTKLSNGTTYGYAVKAYNGSRTSTYTGKSISRLTPPTISSCVSSKVGSFTVKWATNAKATGYQVKYYRDDWDTDTFTIKNNTTASYTVNGLYAYSTYKVYVRSYRDVNGTRYYSSWSGKTIKIKDLPYPQNCKASSNSAGTATVTWSKVAEAAGYELTCTSPYGEIKTYTIKNNTTLSYTFKNLRRGKKYEIRVRAYKVVGDQEYSSESIAFVVDRNGYLVDSYVTIK